MERITELKKFRGRVLKTDRINFQGTLCIIRCFPRLILTPLFPAVSDVCPQDEIGMLQAADL